MKPIIALVIAGVVGAFLTGLIFVQIAPQNQESFLAGEVVFLFGFGFFVIITGGLK
jgi:hypothetical protein